MSHPLAVAASRGPRGGRGGNFFPYHDGLGPSPGFSMMELYSHGFHLEVLPRIDARQHPRSDMNRPASVFRLLRDFSTTCATRAKTENRCRMFYAFARLRESDTTAKERCRVDEKHRTIASFCHSGEEFLFGIFKAPLKKDYVLISPNFF